MRTLIIATSVASTMLFSQDVGYADQACSNNPCVYQEVAPRIVIKKVVVYVERGKLPPPVVRKKTARKKPSVQIAKVESECEFVEYSHGYASQPVLFFQYSEDARCQKRKILCGDCTDWIHGKRGPVFGPASGMKGGRSKAYAPPAGDGAWVPRHNKGVIAYCDQARGNTTYSWLLKN